MRWIVLAVGKARAPYADALAHYERLLRKQARVEVVELKEDDDLEKRIPRDAYVCLLDDEAKPFSSPDFAVWVEDRRQQGRDVCFVIGGPYGIDLTQRPDQRLGLGPATLPHLLARVVLLEQLFRAHKILAGEPYHH